ncbi:MAG: sulfotransferase domain-containing protein [Myxococcota bacterium]
MQSRSRPDFLIVGAPKCGTTAMCRYLAAHPDIFVAERKDLHFFGSDLNFTQRDRLSWDEYQSHFPTDESAARTGEASVWYLYSQSAAAEIAAYNKEMRIIVMLRNPIDLMYAHYTQMRFNGLGDEDLTSFEAALAAEPQRAKGRALPTNTPLPEALLYRRVARLSEQIARYQEHFPASQIRIILIDDMRSDAAAAYRKTLKFLDVDPGFQPDLSPVNTHKTVRSERLRRLISATPSPLKNLIPRQWRRGVRKQIHRLNSQHAKRAPLDPQLRARLIEEFQPEVRRLSAQIDRDLSRWMVP